MLRMVKRKVKMPFRLDLVMGGVSDLAFWADRSGDCLSLACKVSGRAIQMEGEQTKDKNIYLNGFGDRCVFYHSIDEVERTDVSQLSENIQMAIASIQVAISIIRSKGISIKNGFNIKNNSIRQKGMGGSSVFAASLITLICALYGVPKLGINELIVYVFDAEKLCGSNGGWEDIAGSYRYGINKVKYRPNTEKMLSVESPHLAKESLDILQNCLLLIDSGIPAYTGEILRAAYDTFQTNPRQVIISTDIIRSECENFLKELKCNNIEYLGESLMKQREQWSLITGKMSANHQVEEMLDPLKKNIYGYREAGAGGGGTVLIMCKEEKKKDIIQYFFESRIKCLRWEISDHGLEVY